MTWLHGVDHFLAHDDRPAAGEDTPPGVTVDRRGFLSPMDPDATIPFHDHRQYNGVILVLAGEVRCRNFDLVEGQADAREVTIRETSDARLVAGPISTLARHRDNIHDLRTGATGARLLDVFTYLGPSGRSVYLDVDEAAPVDKDRRIYRARWQR